MNGLVEQGKYKTSQQFLNIGVIGGGDMTIEAALAKLMFLMANVPTDKIKSLVQTSISGERA
jgi:L-asparaginase